MTFGFWHLDLKIFVIAILIILSTLTFFGVQKYRSKPNVTPTPSAKIMSQETPIEKLAKEKLANYLKTDTNQIEIIETKKVDWPDASLGAPEEGMMYAQVITPGYKVTMIAGSAIYEAHTDEQGNQVVIVQNGERL